MIEGKPIQSKHTFEASWRQPEDVDRYLRGRANGYTANVCSGQSPIGDIRIDADLDRNPDIVADMGNLPFPDATFDTVLFDPPWKLNYFNRQSPFFEVVRVTKPNGLILMNALWKGKSENTTVEEPLIVRADDEWSNISVIVPHRKQPGQSTFDGGYNQS